MSTSTVSKIEVPAPNIQMMKVKLVGETPLIFHKWSEKAKKQIRDKQAKKATAGKREVRNPEKEYKDSYYYDKDGNIAIPAVWVKSSMVSAARSIEGVTMQLLKQSIFVMGDEDSMIPIKYKKERMREDMVRVMRGGADLRYRGEVLDWTADVTIRWNADVLSAEQIVNLLMTAGFSCGMGEMRPERTGNAYGTFSVDKKALKTG